MTRSVKIIHDSASVTQSAPALSDKWRMEYVLTSARRAEGLMGWVSSEDTLNQVKLEFDSLEQAKAFADQKGWSYTIVLPHKKKIRGFNYSDNFKYQPPAKDA